MCVYVYIYIYTYILEAYAIPPTPNVAIEGGSIGFERLGGVGGSSEAAGGGGGRVGRCLWVGGIADYVSR